MIYFDITDLFDYLRKNRHVTGIQRVQIKLLHALADLAPEEIRCIVIDETASPRDGVTVYKSDKLFPKAQDGTNRIKDLLKRSRPHRLLDPASVRSALQPYSNRKLYRSLKKIELYTCSLVAPGRLAQLGYQEEPIGVGESVHAEPFLTPRVGDQYVLLGHNWSTPGIGALARSFREAGGQAVQVIHDVIPVKEPTFFPTKAARDFKEYLTRCRDAFSFFIAVSGHTRKDLLDCFEGRVAPQSVAVLRLAHAFGESARNQPCRSPASAALSAIEGTPFVVSVGTVEPRKNHGALIRVWCRLHKELGRNTPTLVIAGKLGWKTDNFVEQLAAAVQQHVPILHVASATDQDLHFLYANCRFSIYPSLYEGWGLPVGESLWLGRPCLASNASSIPEITDRGVAYFDPLNEGEMLQKIRELCLDDTHLADLVQQTKSARLRDWSEVAIDLLDTLQSLRTRK